MCKKAIIHEIVYCPFIDIFIICLDFCMSVGMFYVHKCHSTIAGGFYLESEY